MAKMTEQKAPKPADVLRDTVKTLVTETLTNQFAELGTSEAGGLAFRADEFDFEVRVVVKKTRFAKEPAVGE